MNFKNPAELKDPARKIGYKFPNELVELAGGIHSTRDGIQVLASLSSESNRTNNYENVYKIISQRLNNEGNGIGDADEVYEKEVENSQILQENGLNTSSILEGKKFEDGSYLIKEPYVGTNLEEMIKCSHFSGLENLHIGEVMHSLGEYLSKVHSIPTSEVENEDRLDQMLADNHKEVLNEVDDEYLELLKNPPEEATILFDTRPANFAVEGADPPEEYDDSWTPQSIDMNDISYIDTETMTIGDPMFDIGWLYADLKALEANYPQVQVDCLMDFLLTGYFGVDDSLNVDVSDEEMNRIKEYTKAFYTMPRESGLRAYEPAARGETPNLDSNKFSFWEDSEDWVEIEDVWINMDPDLEVEKESPAHDISFLNLTFKVANTVYEEVRDVEVEASASYRELDEEGTVHRLHLSDPEKREDLEGKIVDKFNNLVSKSIDVS